MDVASDLLIEEDLKQFLLVLLISLSVAAIARIFVWFRQIPYTLLLVISGLGLALVEVRLVELSPGLILFIFLPPLLFEAALNTRWSSLVKNVVPISLFAIGGVFISIAGVAFGLHQFAHVPLMTALLVGACLSATDSASVVGLFREVGASRQLTVLMEGESLFNDGAAVVSFGLVLSLAISTYEPGIAPTLARFLTVTGVGIGVGGLLGFCLASFIHRLDAPWVEQTLTIVAAYGAYFLVEELGGSGVIGVVTVGLILGNYRPVSEDSQTQHGTTEFWEFLAFFVNSIVFLLLGDQIHYSRMIGNLGTTAVGAAAVVLSRAIAIYGFSALSNRFARTQISWQNQTILWWGGFRGAVSIALALSIPMNLPGHEEIIANVFGVVIFTLLFQGLTTKFLMQRLGLIEDQSLQQQYLELLARREASSQMLMHLNERNRSELSSELIQEQTVKLKDQLESFQQEILHLQALHPQLRDFSLQQQREKLLAIESATYNKFLRSGLLNRPLTSLLTKHKDPVL